MEMLGHYLAVYPDASFKVYLSKEQAFDTIPLFVAQATTSDFPIWSDPARKKYQFKFIDKNSNPYKISCNGWIILSVVKYFLFESHTEIKVVSPDGEIRQIDTCEEITLESIARLLPFINQFRAYKDWSYYDLKQENLRLVTENQELKEELSRKD